MTNSKVPTSIRQRVLEKVQSGSIRRRSRFYFISRVVAAIIVALLLLISTALIISFVFFSLHESGEQFLLGFGPQGILVFLELFPWWPALFTLALVFLLEWLLQGFKIGYRIPLLPIFIGILAVSILAGVIISATPLHGLLMQRADSDDLPIIGPAYEHILDHHDDQGVCRGIVTSLQPHGFTMTHNDEDHDADDGTFMVVPVPGSTFLMPHVGDRVLVFGHPEMNHIAAQGVQILPPLPPHS